MIPILVNVISDILNDLRHGKKALDKSDEISLTVFENGTDKAYHLEGNVDDVIKVMKELGNSSLQTLSLKNCHTAIAIDNMIMDPMLTSSSNHQTFDEIAIEYQKVFNHNSAIEIGGFVNQHEKQEEIVSYKASLLMQSGEYEAAYYMMRPLVNKAQSIEFLYNFSLCLSHLDVNDDILIHSHEQVIKKYLACPDLLDLEKFQGNIKQSKLNEATQNLIEKGIFIETDDGTITKPVPQTDEEIKKEIDIHNAVWDYIRKTQEYDTKDLLEESAINAVEIQLKNELEQINTDLKTLANIKEKSDIKKFNCLINRKLEIEQSLEQIELKRNDIYKSRNNDI